MQHRNDKTHFERNTDEYNQNNYKWSDFPFPNKIAGRGLAHPRTEYLDQNVLRCSFAFLTTFLMRRLRTPHAITPTRCPDGCTSLALDSTTSLEMVVRIRVAIPIWGPTLQVCELWNLSRYVVGWVYNPHKSHESSSAMVIPSWCGLFLSTFWLRNLLDLQRYQKLGPRHLVKWLCPTENPNVSQESPHEKRPYIWG